MMNIQDYYNHKKSLYDSIFEFIEDGNESDMISKFDELKKFFADNEDEFYHLLHFISLISNNYHRSSRFFERIEIILITFSDIIKQKYTNNDIFNLFRENKRILLFLFDKQIIKLDQSIIDQFQNKDHQYFYPEVQSVTDNRTTPKNKQNELQIEDFKIKRNIGENDDYICYLIRNDSVEDFISYINRKNIPLSTTIKPSIFETNAFLIDKKPTLIEYTAFFGAISIFQYLRLNNIELTSSLWLYSIHGRNADIIHYLESDHIEPPEGNYDECLKEAIKCHHNEIARYIQNYLIKVIFFLEINVAKKASKYALRYDNYEILNEDFIDNEVFFYACYYNHINLVKILVNNDEIDINFTKI